MDFEILKATIEMADEIGEIGFASWNAAYADIVPEEFLKSYTPQKRADSLRKALSTRPEEYYLFKSSGKPIGFSIIGPPQDVEFSEKIGEIHAIYFVPDSWGRGYSSRAISFCLSRLNELGYSSVVLWVLEGNLRARRFYEKHGFQFTGQRKEISIGKPLFEICYSLDFSLDFS